MRGAAGSTGTQRFVRSARSYSALLSVSGAGLILAACRVQDLDNILHGIVALSILLFLRIARGIVRQIDIFGTSLPVIPQNRPPYGENADSAPRRKRAGSAKRAGDPERGLLQCGYLEYARKRKVTIWPRVQLSSGLNVVLEVPSVTFWETAQPTASA